MADAHVQTFEGDVKRFYDRLICEGADIGVACVLRFITFENGVSVFPPFQYQPRLPSVGSRALLHTKGGYDTLSNLYRVLSLVYMGAVGGASGTGAGDEGATRVTGAEGMTVGVTAGMTQCAGRPWGL